MNLFGPKPQPVRRPKRQRHRATAAEIAARAKARAEAQQAQRDQEFLDEMKRTNYPLYQQIMLGRVAAAHGQSLDPFDQYLAMRKKMRDAGLEPKGSGRGADDGGGGENLGAIGNLARGLGMGVVDRVKQHIDAQQQGQGQPTQQPAEIPTPSAAALPQATQAAPGAAPPPEMAELAQYAPPEAARWLLQHLPAEVVVPLARMEPVTPASVQAALLPWPDLTALGVWLASRDAWTATVVACLRTFVFGPDTTAAPASPLESSAPPAATTMQEVMLALAPLSAEQAAAWLGAHLAPDVLAQLLAIPEGQEAAFLGLAPMMRPELADLAEWLRGRLDWTRATLAALRALRSNGQAAAVLATAG